jgi:hypothetical protein
MNVSPRTSSGLWLLGLLIIFGSLLWIQAARLGRVNQVTNLARVATPADRGEAEVVAEPAAAPPNALIVPERNEESYRWIAQTRRMFARGEWRVRHSDAENAPPGVEVRAPSPYRWWLGGVAGFCHVITGRPLAWSVDRAASWANPLLQIVMLLGATIFAARQFGRFAAMLFLAGAVFIFPFGSDFLPGVPDHHGLARMCALGGILALLAGLRDARRSWQWGAIAGVAGGLGVWIDVTIQIPILIGLAMSAWIAAWIGRPSSAGERDPAGPMPAWRTWAWSGAATILVAYFVEYGPSHLRSWNLETVHPLYSLAWIGLGEWVVRTTAWIDRGKFTWKRRDAGVLALSLAAIAAVPWLMHQTGQSGFLSTDLLSWRLTNLPHGSVAPNFWAWLIRDGITAKVGAVVLPVIVVPAAAWMLLRPSLREEDRLSLAIAFGPVGVALGFSFWQLSWWNTLDVTLLALMVAAVGGARSQTVRRCWTAIFGLIAIAGLAPLLPLSGRGSEIVLTSAEAEQLIERHLAHWLTGHGGAKDAVVYAPPHASAALSFYSGLRSIGTFAPDNTTGFRASLVIAGAMTMERVHRLLQERAVRYIVVPSWDRFFDDFARLYLADDFSGRTSLLIHELRQWNLPLWLRPVAYQMPPIGGFEQQSVRVFEVVEAQKPADALSRLVEYLVEIGDLDHAALMAKSLRRYPADLGALAAQAQVDAATGDEAGFATTVKRLKPRLAGIMERRLAWDRRVSVAVVLARANELELARKETSRCLSEANEGRLRSLSTGSLYRLQVLGKAFDLTMTDPELRRLARELLPADLRTQF